ncbi:uncharacterized protein RHOBADRAFT_31193 [Rhodotorula graminis WP1]|uniref:3-methyl-2-oxobutanoate hydroxymethyltransferase n=1 Tax=Rhodotorula graminis (strain WP1) TaxID=578459 RepID=A0A194SA00_RHOGW|nr:uncharacterized protein RHOBADRAFT_31193 [Rhodotorula graminis WP1]KPV77290.1 hypothetical protein RHOBADRAFT_31193 [Rhodotorula graminis WP1]
MSTGSVARPVTNALRAASAPLASSSRTSLSLAPAPPRARTRQNSHLVPSANAAPPRKKRTILDLQALKRKNVPITMLTAHDFPSARFVESAARLSPSSSPTSSSSAAYPRGVDICLVGDSLAMVACGYSSTSDLTLDEMLYHCRSVARGCTTSLLLADLPFGTYYASVDDGVRAAVRLVQEGKMDAVKIEGGLEIVPLVRRLSEVGIPVMAHIGLTPQRQAALSGYRVQGKTVSSALKVWHDALALQDAGAFALLVEAVPSRLAAWMTDRLKVPTIGIGAGQGASGQVLVQLDMLGVDSDLGAEGKGPRFLKRFADVGEQARRAVRDYVEEVRLGSFPSEGTHTYPMSDEAFEGFLARLDEEEAAKKA